MLAYPHSHTSSNTPSEMSLQSMPSAKSPRQRALRKDAAVAPQSAGTHNREGCERDVAIGGVHCAPLMEFGKFSVHGGTGSPSWASSPSLATSVSMVRGQASLLVAN